MPAHAWKPIVDTAMMVLWCTLSERAARFKPSRQKPSVIGFAMLDTNGSRHCVNASRPQLRQHNVTHCRGQQQAWCGR